MRFRIEYVTDSRERSLRVVEPLEGFADERSFDAFCHLRGENRTFRWQCITSATELPSGEELTTARLFERILPGVPVPPRVQFLPCAAVALAVVAFSRQVVGKFDEKRRIIVAQELLQSLPPGTGTLAQLVEFISTGLPHAQRLYEGVEVLSSELTKQERASARAAAFRLVRGSGRAEPSQALIAEVERLFRP